MRTNAEYGMGIWLSVEQQREKLAKHVEELAEKTDDAKIKETAAAWLASYNDKSSRETGEALKNAILESGLLSENADLVAANVPGDNVKALAEAVRENFDHLTKKSVWFFGGDGWAYDIGYGGLDHVLASGADVNVMVFDTEIYSNTGGQASKATPTGALRSLRQLVSAERRKT